MNKMKFLTLGLCLTIVGADIGTAIGYIAGALISNYMDKN